MEEIINDDADDVKKRADTYLNLDPFPDIAPSLLNSADIFDYVKTTGLIAPFYKDNLKPASYGVRLKGEYIYWKTKDEVVEGKLHDLTEKDAEGDLVFTLKRNSIAYVALEPEFRFPSYIAARFNLKIKHIYQGLLLGTGPLVDPGFQGKIFVPLHNLTNNDYKIKIDKPLIWMEFTKISSSKIWNEAVKEDSKRTGIYVPFAKEKLLAKPNLRTYLHEAHPNAPILSTIPGILEDNKEQLKKFEGQINEEKIKIRESIADGQRLSNTFNIAIIVAIITFGITFLGSVILYYSNQNRLIDYMDKTQKDLREAHSKIIDDKKDYMELKGQLLEIQNSMKQQEAKKNPPIPVHAVKPDTAHISK